MRRYWEHRGTDSVREHFQRLGLKQPTFKIKGWFFRSYDQITGSEFAWGISDRSPWHEQFSNLLRATGIDQAIMHTVTPQPAVLSLQGTAAITLQLMAPYQFKPSNLLMLVIERSFTTPPTTAAILCHQPCTVYGVFVIVGLSKWCGLEHQCTATFPHGACSRIFHDLEQLRVPTASRIILSSIKKSPDTCRSQTSTEKISQAAKRIADTVLSPGDSRHQRVFKSARRILLHRTGHQTENDASSFMQRPAPDVRGEEVTSSDQSRNEATMTISDTSSGPPPVVLQPNRDVAWHDCWQAVRRHVTEYSRAVGRRQLGLNQYVHLLICQAGRTRSIGSDCPDWLLQEDQPLHLFTNWCQHLTFAFDARYTRAFPATTELFQNVPSFVVIDHVPSDRAPLIVHITSSEAPISCIYEAAAIERVANVLYWLNRYVMVLRRIAMTLNGRRVNGGDDVPVRPGDVLRIRVVPREEELFPGESTTEATASLGQVSHDTWSSLAQTQSMPPTFESVAEEGASQTQ